MKRLSWANVLKPFHQDMAKAVATQPARWHRYFACLLIILTTGACSILPEHLRSRSMWQNQEGRFKTSMLITPDHDKLVEQWANATNEIDLSALPTTDQARKGQKIYAVIFFANCLDPTPNICDQRVDFSIFGPDGSIYGTSYSDVVLWSGRPPATDSIRLGLPYMVFIADPLDTPGPYKFFARIHTTNSLKHIDVERIITVSE